MYLLILFHSALFYPITLIDRKMAEKFQFLIHANQCVDTARSRRDINITIRRDELAFRNPGEIKQDFLGGRGRNESIPPALRVLSTTILECRWSICSQLKTYNKKEEITYQDMKKKNNATSILKETSKSNFYAHKT